MEVMVLRLKIAAFPAYFLKIKNKAMTKGITFLGDENNMVRHKLRTSIASGMVVPTCDPSTL